MIDSLRRSLRGMVYGPTDPDFATLVQPWNTAIHQVPAAAVLPDSACIADDVAAVMRIAAAQELHVAVQGTGHGATGRVDSDTILIVMSHLRGVEIEGSQAIVQPGARWSDLVGPASLHGLAGLAGSSADVGILGYSLGGGIGWLGRAHGLSCNAIVEAQLVTPDGSIVSVDDARHPDLFWAIRGGLANFGVVTHLRIQLIELRDVQAGYLTYPADRAVDVLDTACAWAMELPDAVTSTAMVVNPPSGAFAYVGLCCIDPALDVRDVMRPLASLGAPQHDTVQRMAAADLGQIHLDPLPPTASVSDARLVSAPLDTEGLRPHLPGPERPLALVEFRRLGGALGRSQPSHGALDRLEGDFLLFCLGVDGATGTRQQIDASIDGVVRAMGSPGRTALNFVDAPTSARSEFAVDSYRRLAEIRRRVDPDDLMRASHSVDLTA